MHEYEIKQPEVTPADIEMVQRIFKKLHDCYPGHRWEIEYNSDPTGGIVHIINPALNAALNWTNKEYGYTLHLSTIFTDPDLKCVMRAGGEILERMRLVRGFHKGEKELSIIDGVKDFMQPINKLVI